MNEIVAYYLSVDAVSTIGIVFVLLILVFLLILVIMLANKIITTTPPFAEPEHKDEEDKGEL